MLDPRRSRFVVRRISRTLFVVPALALATLVPAGSVAPAAVPPDTAAAKPAPPDGPSIQALELAAHANDGRLFTAGDRVTVGYTPRADDAWQVDGATPVSLPAGRASGRAMAQESTGSVWASSSEALAASGSEVPAATDSERSTLRTDFQLDAFVGSRKQVIGFLPYWQLGSSINYRVVSTIAYFAVNSDRYGNLVKTSGGATTQGWAGWTSSAMTSVINTAHSYGDRVVLTVAMMAWDSAGAYAQADFLNSSSAQLNLAKQIAAAVRDRGADGVNLDFEPIVSGGGPLLAAFVRTLRAQLNTINAGYQLTLDTTPYVGNYPLGQLNSDGKLDAVLVMGYDLRAGGNAYAGSIDPLVSASVYDLTNAIDAFTKYMPPSKIILGLPWYGRAWSTVSNGLRAATHSGSTYGYSVTATYDTAAYLGSIHGTYYDTAENSAWTAYTGTYGTTATWRELYWDNPRAEGVKADYINARGLRGAGIWALGYDGGRADLYTVLASKFPNVTNPKISFTFPPAGKTTVTRSTTNTIVWSATDPSGIRSMTITEWYGGKPINGSCANVSWTADWTHSYSSPLPLYGYVPGCHHYQVKATSYSGGYSMANSGNLLIGSLPSFSWTFPPIGTTSLGARSSNTIRWSVYDVSGIRSWTITEWYGKSVNGTCNGVAWTTRDWTASYHSPLPLYGYIPGCYHYQLRVTNGYGFTVASNSGNLLVR